MLPARILVFGKDEVLLESRRLVLEHAGFVVATSLDLDVTLRLLEIRDFELFIVCHSLSNNERKAVLTKSRSLDRPPLNFILNTTLSTYSGNLGEEMSNFTDPETFITTVRRLFLQQPETSAQKPALSGLRPGGNS